MAETSQSPLLHFDLTEVVIGAFFEAYNELGGGFPEKVLSRALAIAIRQKGLTAIEQMELPVWFRGRSIVTFEADIVVERKLIVEVKAAPEILQFHRAQLLHYLKATDIEVGLLLNFGREPRFMRQIYENDRKLRHFPEPTPEELERTFEPRAAISPLLDPAGSPILAWSWLITRNCADSLPAELRPTGVVRVQEDPR